MITGAPLAGVLLLSGQVAIAAPAADTDSGPERTRHIPCERLENPPEDDAAAWFAHSLIAQRCYGFQAVALRLGMGSLRTFLLEQRVRDGVGQQRIQYLDGQAETIEKPKGSRGLWWTDRAAGDGPASIDTTVARLETLYDFTLVASDIVAGRKALVIDIAPRDSLRFPLRLWVDLASALPLRQQLLDNQGQAVDTIQVVRLDSLVRSHDRVDVAGLDRSPPESMDWRPDWLPEGFHRQPADPRAAPGGVEVERQLYSDGLATLSVFMAPAEESVTLREGVHQLGSFRAAARFMEYEGRSHQVIAVGMVPAETLARVVAGVDPASAAGASSAKP